jgi:hypothetical protein
MYMAPPYVVAVFREYRNVFRIPLDKISAITGKAYSAALLGGISRNHAITRYADDSFAVYTTTGTVRGIVPINLHDGKLADSGSVHVHAAT